MLRLHITWRLDAPLLFWGTINIQRDDQRKMKQHKKNKSIIIAVITTQAGSQATDLGEIVATAREAIKAADSWWCSPPRSAPH